MGRLVANLVTGSRFADKVLLLKPDFRGSGGRDERGKTFRSDEVSAGGKSTTAKSPERRDHAPSWRQADGKRPASVRIIRDSAVAGDSEREAQAFCSIASSVLLDDSYEVEVHGVPKSQTTLKARRWVPSLRHAYASCSLAQI